MSAQTISPAPARAGHRTSVLTLLAGALFLVVPPVVELVTYDAFLLMGVALLMLVVALPGLHRLQAGRDGRLGLWGLRLTVAGLVAMVVLVLSGDVLDAALSGTAQSVAEGLWTVVAGLAALSALGGVVAFAVGLTRGRVLAPAGIWLFLGGMVVGLVSESFEQSLDGTVPWLADVLPPAGFMAAGVGLVVLGMSARRVEG
ncbi:hypothetical protein [Nocardioides dilutus]